MKYSPLLLSTFCLFGYGCGTNDPAPDAVEGEPAAVKPAEDTAEAAMLQIMDGVKNGQPIVTWNALPESYQQDVNGIVQEFANAMDADLWNQITGVLKSVSQLLSEKGEFIQNHPAVAASDDPETAKAAVPHVAGLLKSILDGAGDLEKLKSFDGAEFLNGSGAELLQHFDALAKLAPPGSTPGPVGLAAISSAKIETLESTDSTATLLVSQEGQKGQEVKFVKTDGKWLPEEMVATWAKGVADAKASIGELSENAPQMKMQVGMMTGMVSGMLAPLQSATTQEQFNTAASGLLSGPAGMMMGLPPGAAGGLAPATAAPVQETQSANPVPAAEPKPAAEAPATEEPAEAEPETPAAVEDPEPAAAE